MYVSVYPQGLPWPPALSMKVAKIRSLFTTKEHPYMPEINFNLDIYLFIPSEIAFVKWLAFDEMKV